MYRKVEQSLVDDLTIVVREDVTLGNKFLRAGEEFYYVAHLCPDERSSTDYTLFVDQEGTEFATLTRAVPDAMLDGKLDFISKDKQ